jgi:3-oxoacyl-[acyl-carrier protein] reductase
MGLLEHEIAIITGSTRGIGRAMAERFASEGARVVVHGTRQSDAASVAEEIPGALGIGADVSNRAAFEALVVRVNEEWGAPTVLVNNAGVSSRAAITRVRDEDWDRVLKVNLSGPLYAARAVIPGMKANGRGVIVNVTSTAGTHGLVGFSAYGASKAGLVGLTLTWAKELAPFGIRVNALAPGAITDMMRELPPDVLQPIVDQGLPTAEAVANAGLFLASDLSSTVTGQVIHAIGRPPG